MKFWKNLQNPFALVGQGFVLGGILFFASLHQAGQAHVAASGASPHAEGAALQR